jgi:hypothetical protein
LCPEHLFGAGHELGAVARLPQRVGADDAQLLGRDLSQSLAEARQAIKRALLRHFGQPVAAVETGSQLHHLAQSVEHLHLAVRQAGDDHVKTVRAEVDCRHEIGRHVGTPAQG